MSEAQRTSGDALWRRGELAFQSGVSSESMEDVLYEDYVAGLLSSEQADMVRYGYDHALRPALASQPKDSAPRG